MELLEDKSDDFGQRKSSGTHHSKSQSQMPYNLRKRTRKKDWDCGATNKKAKQKRKLWYILISTKLLQNQEHQSQTH